MPEVSLAKQLSGTEALDSMLAALRSKLALNGRFHSHMAYSGYRAILRLEFHPAMSFIPSVDQTVEVENLAQGDVLAALPTVDVTVEIPIRPPNQVREESDMKTPVMALNEKGEMVEKWVHKGGKPPKNKKGASLGREGDTPLQTMVPTAFATEKMPA